MVNIICVNYILITKKPFVGTIFAHHYNVERLKTFHTKQNRSQQAKAPVSI